MQVRLLSLPQIAFRKKLEVRYLRAVCWILVLLAALRGSTVGTDTRTYIEDFNNMPNLSFTDVLVQKADFPVYFLLAKTCSFLHFPIQILFAIVAGLYIYAIYKFINRFSEGKLYSIMCFVVIGLYAFSLAGLKQTLSMAFVLFYYLALIDKKYIKTILLAVVAYFCHHASAVFLFGVGLYFMRNLKAFYIYLAILVLIMLLSTNFLWTNMLELLENDHYTNLYTADEGYTSTTMIFYGVLTFFLFICSRNYGKTKKAESRVVLGLSTLAFTWQAFSFVSANAFRLSYFFVPFMIVGFPNDFNRISDANTKQIIKFAVAFMVVFFFIYTNRNGGSVVPYRFFWQ